MWHTICVLKKFLLQPHVCPLVGVFFCRSVGQCLLSKKGREVSPIASYVYEKLLQIITHHVII